MSSYHNERFPFPSPRRLREELRLRRPPIWMGVALAVVVVLTWVPLAIVGRMRVTLSDQPRFQPVQDMAIQPRLGPQDASSLFADGRAMRPPVPGAVAVGRLNDDDHYYRGYEVRHDADSGEADIHFFQGLPSRVTVDNDLISRGALMYSIQCAACHGPDGDGQSAMNRWGQANPDANWVEAWSLLKGDVAERQDGHLYNSIRNGIRNMPAHGPQIDVHDRWAIVAYMRHLQRQNEQEPDR